MPRWEAGIERAIGESIARGEFDGLPGAGKPLAGLDGPRDELWWVKEKLRREELATLPPTLAIRREREQLLEDLGSVPSEPQLRVLVEDLNQRIRRINKYGAVGPPSSTMPLDVDDVVERWRAARHSPDRAGPPANPVTPPA